MIEKGIRIIAQNKGFDPIIWKQFSFRLYSSNLRYFLWCSLLCCAVLSCVFENRLLLTFHWIQCSLQWIECKKKVYFKIMIYLCSAQVQKRINWLISINLNWIFTQIKNFRLTHSNIFLEFSFVVDWIQLILAG